jgi:hypothetical protein
VTAPITDEKNTTRPSADASASAPQQSAAQSTSDGRQWQKKEVIREGFRNKTKGEAWFNGGSYIGVGYGVVTAISVFMTWLLNDTQKFAAKYGAFAGKITSKLGVHSSFGNIVALFLGGTIASVLPVKWLEDKKPEIVKKLDRMLYSDEELNDPKIIAAHKELDEMPKQTWASVFSSRVVAFAATVSVFLLMGSNKSPLAKHTGESIDKRSIQFGRWFDKLLHRGNPEIVAQIDKAIETNIAKMSSSHGENALKGLEVVRDKVGGDRIASRIYSYIGLDAFYTAITSASLFIFTRIFGGLIGKAPEPRAHNKQHAPATHPVPAMLEASVVQSTKPASPHSTITSPTHLSRLAAPAQTAELTA